MRLALRLLGPPSVARDGVAAAPPRGKKVWALLAYLARAEAPVSRERLASLLFADAYDPLGALRWSLAELRRLLGDSTLLRGEPLVLTLPADSTVDVDQVLRGTWRQALSLETVGEVFLEGLNFPGAAAFEAWLLTERRHLANASAGVMREAVVGRIAAGAAEDAVLVARKLVQIDPLDEAYQALLIRSLAATGDRAAAQAQFESCRALLMAELGVTPGPDVLSAVDAPTASAPMTSVGGRASARAQLDAGQAAIAAGVVDAGLECLRRAVAEAEPLGDAPLRAEALFALGSALIHSLRGRDEEGSIALHQAIAAGLASGMASLVAAARRELGYVEMLRARYDRAQTWLAEALDAAADDVAEQAAIRVVLGACWSDTAHYSRAMEQLEQAIALAEQSRSHRQVAFASSFLGRAQLLTGATAAARETLTASIRTAQREGWTSLIPWPESMLGDCLLADGDVDGATEIYEHAFALGCQLGDPCWEGMAARGIGLVKERRGDVGDAIDWLDDARTRCVRVADAYLWIRAYCEDALCAVAISHGVPGATGWVDELEAHAGPTGMREFVVRAYLYRHRAGSPSALLSATELASAVANPALHAEISQATRRLAV